MSGGVRCDHQGGLPEGRNTRTRTRTPESAQHQLSLKRPPSPPGPGSAASETRGNRKDKQRRLLRLLGLALHRQALQAASPTAWVPCTLVPFPTSISITDLFSQTPAAMDFYAETESLQIRM